MQNNEPKRRWSFSSEETLRKVSATAAANGLLSEPECARRDISHGLVCSPDTPPPGCVQRAPTNTARFDSTNTCLINCEPHWLDKCDAGKLPNKAHWSERGRATPVANADALGRPRRSVLSLDGITHTRHISHPMKINDYPRPWSWAAEPRPRRLSEWALAPDTNGFYELGLITGGSFEPKYCGRAAGVSLRQRLRQHFLCSHNHEVRLHASELSYRCKSFDSADVASYVEAVHIVALDYEWNKRNEWTKHWALES